MVVAANLVETIVMEAAVVVASVMEIRCGMLMTQGGQSTCGDLHLRYEIIPFSLDASLSSSLS